MGTVFLAITGRVSYSEVVPRLLPACAVVVAVVVAGLAPAIADAIDICVS